MAKTLPTKRTAETVLKKLISPKDLKVLSKEVKVILMVGMPGSGKSTISQLLASAYGFWRFSSDQIRMEELFPDQSHRVADEHEKVMLARYQVYQELSRRVATAVQRGQRVIVDSTNLDDKRDMIMQKLLEVTKPESIAFVTVKTPEEIMKNRFKWEGEDSAKKWVSVYEYWKNYLNEGKASYPTASTYPGTHVFSVKRYDLETFDWITEIGVIVWDVDRTLYQPVPEINEAIQNFLLSSIQEKFKISKSEAQDRFHKEYEQHHSSTLSLEAMGFDGRQLIDTAFQNIDLETHLRPDPKLKKLLQSLNQFHHVILTNGTRTSTERKLKALGIPLKLFSEIYATYELPVIKPDPHIFRHVIKQTNFGPNQHLMVGDEIKTDILPAKTSGMRTARIGEATDAADIFFKNVYGVGRLFGIEIA
jgi:HAD superfamily hydrolase (TIGR01549 family)